jgi:integrase
MAVVRTLIPKRLVLIIYRWQNNNGGSYSYRARIWQQKLKKYSEVTLKARDEGSASEEAYEVYAQHLGDLKSGKEVGKRRKPVKHYVEEFVASQQARATLNQISQKRVVVVQHALKSLIHFSTIQKNPPLDDLSAIYDNKFIQWRAEHKARVTGNPLSTRYLNNELSVHKQFFLWAVANNFCNRPIQSKELKVKRANNPFPKKNYPKLLSVARKEIEESRNTRIKWELMNYRTLLMLMNGIGCRVVETKNMKWSDLTNGKNGVTLYIHGKDKERTIQIPDRVAGHLEDLRKFKRNYGKAFGWAETDHPFIFSSWKSEKPPNQFDATVRRRWMKEAGIDNPKDYELVCFRHKFITEALNNGVHSLAVAQYTGTSQKMIEKTYSGLVTSDVFNLVFKNSPDEAMSRNAPRWLDKLIEE